MLERVETSLLAEAEDVDRKLAELGLDREGLLRVVNVARVERANATNLHPANAAGTFAYHHGVAALRREFVGKSWEIDRGGGVETIRHVSTGIRVGYCNVDAACGRDHPLPCSDKGAAAERLSGPLLFDDLKVYAPAPGAGPGLYYLMIDEQGRAELMRPVIAQRTFVAALERIFIVDQADDDGLPSLGADDVADGFEPQIARTPSR